MYEVSGIRSFFSDDRKVVMGANKKAYVWVRIMRVGGLICTGNHVQQSFKRWFVVYLLARCRCNR
jgi:hypothetical protein